MGKLKIPGIDLNDFQRDFRKNISEPLQKKLGLNTKAPEPIKQQVGELKEIIHEQLPSLIWGWVQHEEKFTFKTGSQKHAGVVQKLEQWARANGYARFVPIFIPMIESAVRMIYPGKIESIFEILELEVPFEKWLGFTVSSTPNTAKTEAVKPEEKKVEEVSKTTADAPAT